MIHVFRPAYATTIGGSRYARGREFLKAVHNFVADRGKELGMLMDDYWERLNLQVHIYFSAGLTLQANMYYTMLINLTSQKVQDSYATHNAFDFKNVRKLERSMLNAPSPCVLFSLTDNPMIKMSQELSSCAATDQVRMISSPGESSHSWQAEFI